MNLLKKILGISALELEVKILKCDIEMLYELIYELRPQITSLQYINIKNRWMENHPEATEENIKVLEKLVKKHITRKEQQP